MTKNNKTATDRIIWIDIESTGLDPATNFMLELGLAITTPHGRLINMSNWVIRPSGWSEWVYEQMAPEVKKMHTENLLLDEIGMNHAVSAEEAQVQALDWLDEHDIHEGEHSPAGSSVHFDRKFVGIEMPRLDGMFHYRIKDLSSVREWARVLSPSLSNNEPDTLERHRVLPDLKDSIRLYRFYVAHFFNAERPSSLHETKA